MKKAYALALVVVTVTVLTTVFALCGCGLSRNPDGYAFGVYYSVSIENGSVKANEISALLDRIDNTFSLTVSDSDLSAVNAAAVGERTEISSETAALLNFADTVYRDTEGAFNPYAYSLVKLWGFAPPFSEFDTHSVPSADAIAALLPACSNVGVSLGENYVTRTNPDTLIDLGGMAKGYAVGLLVDYLQSKSKNALIDIGGNLAAVGKSYNIGLRCPRPSEYGYLLSFTLEEGYTCATSGDYEKYFEQDGKRYCHIIGKDGYSAQSDIISVTVIAKDAALADALSTAIFVMGAEKGAEYIKTSGLSAIIVTSERKVVPIGVQVTIKDGAYSL